MITLVMTVSANHNRLSYLDQSLKSLSQCRLASQTSVFFGVEPNDAKGKTMQIIRRYIEHFKQVTFVFNKEVLGIARNTYSLLKRAFDSSNFVICLEEDMLCSKDALVYFYSMLTKFENDPTIFTINGASLSTPEEKKNEKDVHGFKYCDHFCPIGWALNRSRWKKVRHKFLSDKRGYAFALQQWRIDNKLTNIRPKISRCLHIGEVGVHTPKKELMDVYLAKENFNIDLDSWKYLENGACLAITNFNRNHLLNHTLNSIERQLPLSIGKFEVLVLNEGERGDIDKICDRPFVRVFQTKTDSKKWRAPCIPFNIGAKLTDAEIYMITCSEIYHLNDALNPLIDATIQDKLTMAIPVGWDDVVSKKYTNPDTQITKTKSLNTKLPFLMSFWRETFLAVGGYDENFSDGVAFDDSDFITRLIKHGCVYSKTTAEVVHLYHSRFHTKANRNPEISRREERNKALYHEKHWNFSR